MIRNSRLEVVFIILAIISWVFLTTYTLQVSVNHTQYNFESVFPEGKIFIKNIFLTSFFLFIFLFFRQLYANTTYESINKSTWPSDFTNLTCLALHFTVLIFEHIVSPPVELKLWLNILNNFNILIETVFCANCFYYFKNLILHKKTKQTQTIWKVFEIMTYGSISLSFINVNLDQTPTIIGLSIFSIIALYLSLQMKWVAYQERNEKIKYILRFILFLITLALVLQNIFFESIRYGDSATASHLLVIDSAHKFFILSTSAFVMFYCISSTLILLFNLPTSSVFEEKMLETYNFKQLTKNLSGQETRTELLQLLLDSCLSTSRATKGWIKWHDNDTPIISSNIDIENVKKLAKITKNITQKEHLSLPNTKEFGRVFQEVKASSLIIKPIIVNNELIAQLGLIKDVEFGFNHDTQEIIESYINQTSTTLENQIFLNKALENERYREEQKIALGVKQKLLNKELEIKGVLEYDIFFESTDMVGGDFFESYKFNNNSYLVVIGDVSGHGTSAAFNMSQLNGIFHSVVSLSPEKKDIPSMMNDVLKKCLSQNSFISLSYFFINTDKQEITHSRCGHNPAIFRTKSGVNTLNPKGIGLGILDKNKFQTITESIVIPYESGDELFCYTDGITETINNKNEQYTEDQLIQLVKKLPETDSAEKKLRTIRESINRFRDNAKPKDDSTCLVIKF